MMNTKFIISLFISLFLSFIVVFVFQPLITGILMSFFKVSSDVWFVITYIFLALILGLIFYKVLFHHSANKARYFHGIARGIILIFITIGLSFGIAFFALFVFARWFNPGGWGAGALALLVLVITFIVSLVPVYYILSKLNPPR